MPRIRQFFVVIFHCALVPLVQGQLLEQNIKIAPDVSRGTPLFSGSSVTLITDLRVQVSTPPGSTRPAIRKAVVSSLAEPISASQRAVVYNKSMQAFGLFSGEITFALQSGVDVKSLGLGRDTDPRVLGPAGVYVVNVMSGSEFLRVVTLLKSVRGVSWVEPSIDYIPEAIE
jgi:hypothetical protein